MISNIGLGVSVEHSMDVERGICMSEATSKINALDRGLEILDILARADRSVGVTELGQMLDVDKSTAYRLVSTLRQRGYVEQDSDSSKYHLGLKTLELSSQLLERLQLNIEAKPFLKEVVRQTNETVHLAVLVDSRAVYVDQEKSNQVITVNTSIGSSAPLYCTATGKVLSAYLHEDAIEQIFAGKELRSYTHRTITLLSELKLHLKQVRQRGYAIDDEEYTEGVRCVAVPIRNHTGEVVATLGISGPSTRVSFDRISMLVKQLESAAGEISTRLGYRAESAL
jgi:IclR family KDG regulon transcriptional repressor